MLPGVLTRTILLRKRVQHNTVYIVAASLSPKELKFVQRKIYLSDVPTNKGQTVDQENMEGGV